LVDFKSCVDIARLTGSIFAVTLASKKLFPHRTVSFISFSLGTEVVKSCLETLAELGANDIV
jgi:hypothetical protein